MDQQLQQRVEDLGPAEKIINTLTTFTGHLYHGRPGLAVNDARTSSGTRWDPVIWKEEDGEKIVYRLTKQGKRSIRTKIGTLDGVQVKDGARIIGEYRTPGIFPEVAEYLYKQVAEVWKLDNEFAARWASWAFPREHRDLKVILAAFMLVQNRMGDPVMEDGELLFFDDDFRDVGEAMCLIRAKNDINPKLLLRVGDILNLPGVAQINRELGFGNSAKNPPKGRYYKAVQKWLRYREDNLPLLEGLVKAGFKTTTKKLAQRVGYKPQSSKFFEVLRWKQNQASDGRRTIAIGEDFGPGESWEGLDEGAICETIVRNKPNWKRVVGLIPKNIGITRAIVAAAVESGAMSNQDLIIMTPTFEELGLLDVEPVKTKWKAALESAENQRAANIAKNVKSKEAREGLQDATDKAMTKAVEEVTRDLRVYCIIDKSASMQGALDRAKEYLTKFLGGFPLDRLHVSVFNTQGKELNIKASKAAAVKQAFTGHRAGGGTSYAQGVKVLAHHKPQPSEDALMIFVGDEGEHRPQSLVAAVHASGINPVAFGLLKVVDPYWGSGTIVSDAARSLGIPCFPIDENMFTSDDPYAVTRLFRDLIANTPVGATNVQTRRKTLVQEILETELLRKPLFA